MQQSSRAWRGMRFNYVITLFYSTYINITYSLIFIVASVALAPKRLYLEGSRVQQ